MTLSILSHRAARFAALGALALTVAGCATTDNNTLSRTGIGAGAGAATGAVVGAIAPGVSVVGGAIGGAALGAAGGFIYDQAKKEGVID